MVPWEWELPSVSPLEDLKNANPSARISVKLVARIGIGVIASGPNGPLENFMGGLMTDCN